MTGGAAGGATTGGAAGAETAPPFGGGSATATRPGCEEPPPEDDALRTCPENADAAATESTAASPNEPATVQRVNRETERLPRSREAEKRAGLCGPNTGGGGSTMQPVSGGLVRGRCGEDWKPLRIL